MTVVCDWQPVDALVQLLRLTAAERELWVDSRIVRVPIGPLAEREGVSKQAISLRLQRIDGKLAGSGEQAVAA